jgi:hypothetical protein
VAPLDRIHQQAQQRLRSAVRASVAGMLATVPLDRTDEIRGAYATATARVVNGGEWQAAKLAAAYVGTKAPPVRDLDLAHALEGRLLTPESDNALVGILRLWHTLDEGEAEAAARASAGEYAAGLAETDLQGATRDALDEAADAAGREPRWRLEPDDGACAWCQFIADSGAIYLSAETVPIPHSPGGEHPGGACNCSPAPEF